MVGWVCKGRARSFLEQNGAVALETQAFLEVLTDRKSHYDPWAGEVFLAQYVCEFDIKTCCLCHDLVITMPIYWGYLLYRPLGGYLFGLDLAVIAVTCPFLERKVKR